MSDMEHPVTVKVERGGRVEEVRVGTAVQSGDGFVLRLGELRIHAPGAGAAAAFASATPRDEGRRPASTPIAAAEGAGMVFPNYGRSKGQPIAGADLRDLEFYANGCRRTLADPGKSRWHEKERVLLAAIEAELLRQRGGSPTDGPGDGPGPGGEPAPFDDGRPPPDDDTPF